MSAFEKRKSYRVPPPRKSVSQGSSPVRQAAARLNPGEILTHLKNLKFPRRWRVPSRASLVCTSYVSASWVKRWSVAMGFLQTLLQNKLFLRHILENHVRQNSPKMCKNRFCQSEGLLVSNMILETQVYHCEQ